MTTSLSSYADYYRRAYSFEQRHRRAGPMNFFRLPEREAGSHLEAPVAGVSLQINLTPRRGVARLDLGAGAFPVDLTKRTFVIGPAGQRCRYELPCPLDLLVIELPSHYVADRVNPKSVERLHSRACDDPTIIALAERFWAWSGDQISRVEAESVGITLGSAIVRAFDAHTGVKTIRGGLAARSMRRVREKIEAHLADDIGLSDLALVADLSPWHFSRCFKTETGMTPAAFIRVRRVERAKNFLSGTNMSITQIAHECGFSSSQHMATVFRRDVGMPPGIWRKARLS